MVDECMANFGILLGQNDHVSSAIKLSWIRQIRDAKTLDTPKFVQCYARCHIFCLIGTTLFLDKSALMESCKYLRMLRNFAEISSYSCGSAYLAYLYKSLCQVLRYNTKDMDGPLVLLHV
ncbi:protein MAIN-LIKE 1-like [Arachis ipaensis]|uniref:Aminotransferase-like plant mobile domain-containing protein n=1 Tax=Arachis hypogaea TaxID=3818 RepID=A0A445AIK3_ARAHY|nr:protein MAIN-LIKE 1-like [Arachis ipaensis]XP_025636108.1 protein MAIN-LIKE 1-like [Arachis hypogaea]RYR26261.1 hypothetical protein Ahy_B02g060475 [Arachis hypogaea]